MKLEQVIYDAEKSILDDFTESGFDSQEKNDT